VSEDITATEMDKESTFVRKVIEEEIPTFRVSYAENREGILGNKIIGLDTMAEVSIFKNPDLFHETWEADKTIFIDGVNAEGQALCVMDEGITAFGVVRYHPKSAGNILSFGEMRKNAFQLYYSPENDSFMVQMHPKGRMFYFSRENGNNLYLCNLETGVAKRSIGQKKVQFGDTCFNLITTVQQRKEKYTKQQIDRAERARKLQRKLAYPRPGQLGDMCSRGTLMNNDINTKDIMRAMDIWGPDLGSLKGKATAKKAEAIQENSGSTYDRPIPVTLHVDLMYVDNEVYFVSVATPLELVVISQPDGKGDFELWKHLLRHIREVQKHSKNVVVGEVRTDGESAIDTAVFCDRLAAMSIFLNPAGGAPVPVVERKIRLIKERVRAVYNTLPFVLPQRLMKWLVTFAVKMINFLPTTNACDYVSPYEKWCGRRADMKKDLKHEFGQYVQLHESETDNSMKERTVGAIALAPVGNSIGSWYYFTLKTGAVVKRNSATELPMPDEIIDLLTNYSKIKRNRRDVRVEDDNGDHDDQNQDIFNEINAGNNEGDANEVLDVDANDAYNNQARENNQALIDDIFGDSDSEEEDMADVAVNEDDREDRGAEGEEEDARDVAQPDVERLVATMTIQRLGFVPEGIEKEESRTRYFGLNMTVREGLDKYGIEAVKSVLLEIEQMLSIPVFKPVHVGELSKEEVKSIIPSKLFLKEKFTPSNVFDKLKSRLVGGGHRMDRSMWSESDCASPTVSTSAVFMVAAIAAMEKRAVATCDFPGAYLNCEIPKDGPQVYMKLDKFLTTVLIKLDPSYTEYVRADGTCVVKLTRALYGCIMSSKLWYDQISGALIEMGFTSNPQDLCVFNRVEVDGSQSTISVHVDDFFVTAGSEEVLDKLFEDLSVRYPALVIKRGRVMEYLGMVFDFRQEGKVKITMDGFIDDFLRDATMFSGECDTPATESLFKVDKSAKSLSESEKELYHSMTARCLYLGKRTRPDILTAVSFLTKRVQAPTEQDLRKLARVVKYIRGTRHMGIVLEASNYLSVIAYVDASYGVHEDMKSHTGCTIGIGRGPVYAKSTGQKLNTKSSAESELVALSDSAGQIIWTRNFLIAQGYNIDAATVYEDNQATIAMVNNGKSNSERTRHIAIRFYFVADRVASKEIKIEYMETGSMIADILTKPLQGALFKRLRDMLLNWYSD